MIYAAHFTFDATREQILEIRRIANERDRAHGVAPGQSGQRIRDDYQDLGVMAEYAFGSFIGQKPLGAQPPGGDPGYDFVTALGTVDVKGVVPVKGLNVKAYPKPVAAYYVLVHVLAPTRAALVGWALREEITAAEICKGSVRADGKAAPDYHHLDARDLRPMEEFFIMLGEAEDRRAAWREGATSS